MHDNIYRPPARVLPLAALLHEFKRLVYKVLVCSVAEEFGIRQPQVQYIVKGDTRTTLVFIRDENFDIVDPLPHPLGQLAQLLRRQVVRVRRFK